MSHSSTSAFRTFGLIGFPLSHSFSKKYFDQKFRNEDISNVSYGLFPLKDEQELKKFVLSRNYSGLNVTIPYKQAVMPLLDEISEEARAIGAVNVIQNNNGHLIGCNTDCRGFERALKKWLGRVNNISSALILGTGGSARSIAYAFHLHDIDCAFVSRQADKTDFTYSQLDAEIIKSFPLIVNCTPVGMWPKMKEAPALPYDALGPDHALFDLVYNPEQTEFLRLGAERGARTCNGMKMLIEQAEASWEIWNS